MDNGRLGDDSSWERLCGSNEGCEWWLCMAEEGQRWLAGGGNRRIDVWGSCCGRGNGDMVAGGSMTTVQLSDPTESSSTESAGTHQDDNHRKERLKSEGVRGRERAATPTILHAQREREREGMASSSSAGEDATPTRILISVNESSIRGYPHPSISSRTAFDWTLQKIVRSNVAGFKLLFLHVQIPDEDGTPSPNTLALLRSSPFLLFLLLLLSLFSPLWVYDRFMVLGYGDFGSLALPISHRSVWVES
ncbi:hypothetical protein B296_00030346 [Ensete ventricosum]|uniref:Uncharacterized protein n=1 Tax=Ensete ventricosum TaxID=4639 RepID=A0A427AEW1_ENSVE|nr:hypothetical protein B296_00030346 [Ensete ventricosum]